MCKKVRNSCYSDGFKTGDVGYSTRNNFIWDTEGDLDAYDVEIKRPKRQF